MVCSVGAFSSLGLFLLSVLVYDLLSSSKWLGSLKKCVLLEGYPSHNLDGLCLDGMFSHDIQMESAKNKKNRIAGSGLDWPHSIIKSMILNAWEGLFVIPIKSIFLYYVKRKIVTMGRIASFSKSL